jgi:hypothetical protein
MGDPILMPYRAQHNLEHGQAIGTDGLPNRSLAESVSPGAPGSARTSPARGVRCSLTCGARQHAF